MKDSKKLKKVFLLTSMLIGSFVLVFALVGLLTGSAVGADSPNQGNEPLWTPVFTDSFEGDITADWTLEDGDGADNGEYYWATTSITASEGTSSVWATGGGADGELLTPGTDNYPSNVLSYMIRGPVDISGTTRARLSFDYWLQTQQNIDVLQVQVSTDGTNFSPVETLSGDSAGWQTEIVDLSSYAGEEALWIAFFFSSNGATNDLGAFVDNVILETRAETDTYLPVMVKDPTATPTFTPTPTPTPSPTPSPTPAPFYYFEDFNDGAGGWPTVDHTHDPTDCFRWFTESDQYKVDICDDRTDVKVSPLIQQPDGDYSLEVDVRFRTDAGWWSSYGIIFDGKDDPDPDNPDLGDYYMLWILWEGSHIHKWRILKDVPGDQFYLNDWQSLSDSVYNYGDAGQEWNEWRIERTENSIAVYVNDHHLDTLSEPRPRTNQQNVFGVFASTYETGANQVAYDNVLVDYLNGSGPAWQGTPQPFFDSGSLNLDALLRSEER
jgi:hypothetical protein